VLHQPVTVVPSRIRSEAHFSLYWLVALRTTAPLEISSKSSFWLAYDVNDIYIRRIDIMVGNNLFIIASPHLF
jgi:hypothetical protein